MESSNVKINSTCEITFSSLENILSIKIDEVKKVKHALMGIYVGSGFIFYFQSCIFVTSCLSRDFSWLLDWRAHLGSAFLGLLLTWPWIIQYFRFKGSIIEWIIDRNEGRMVKYKIAPVFKHLKSVPFTEIKSLEVSEDHYYRKFTCVNLSIWKFINVMWGTWEDCKMLGNIIARYLGMERFRRSKRSIYPKWSFPE